MENFKIRTYSKKELALLYFPTATNPHTAVNHLMSWIRRCSSLHDELQRMGMMKTAKCFTPREVRIIVENLGEPF